MWSSIVLVLCVARYGLAISFLEMVDIDDTFYEIWNTRRDYVRYTNDTCGSNEVTGKNQGTCTSRKECFNLKGKEVYDPKCGHFQTCCVVSGKCGGYSSSKISYFEGSTSSTNRLCTFTLELKESVCQVRVDFITFELPDATKVDGTGTPTAAARYTCQNQFLQIYPDVTGNGPICGYYTSQHIYLHFESARPRTITFSLNSGQANANIQERNILLKLTQLNCAIKVNHKHSMPSSDLKLLAPVGCLQYFNESAGEFRSLGYNPQTIYGDLTITDGPATSTPPNTYAICFKRTALACSIRFNIKSRPGSTTRLIYIPPTPTTDLLMTVDHEQLCSEYLFVPGRPYRTNTGTTPDDQFSAKLCPLQTGLTDVRQIQNLLSRSPGLFYLYFQNPRGGGYFDMTYTIGCESSTRN